ncbi:SGNH/GDSL hydrolase family protein [Spirosoma agri]|uniref:SGNH/GDSL hydrolase family protein n=1 Tax=Spirosoma agri TaxID=1987381 RepID=A0A6M0ICQ9_9BACT|nr:SGNH/GDSL hydrolase family protein [Spirosoma agri]NEU65545.1 SGNH/GDSL hydrolase family protein [Spirosoma agri]
MTNRCPLIITLLLAFSMSQWRGLCQAQSPFPANVHRVLFLGNSITYAGGYVTDINAYINVHYPQAALEFINVGLPSETVSGLSEEGHADGKFARPDLHERLARVLVQTKPDLVFACYGMNDGIYLPFDENRFQKFKDGINWLHTELVKSGAQVIHLTPPIYDDLKGGKTGYAAVLDRYADWLLNQKASANWEVIDIHYPMKRFLDAHRNVDATFAIAGFSLADDGVHPGAVGHWIMAKSILLGLGEKTVANAPDIKSAIAGHPNGNQILALVSERQNLMKDAWLTATGHQRPGMKVGLPLADAQKKAAELDARIQALSH